jgi:glycosyltransferase involved in cell wall biosynthesis
MYSSGAPDEPISVHFDAHQLGRRQTGNETYVRELLRSFRDRQDVDVTALIERGQRSVGVLAPPVHLRRVPANGLARLAAMALLARGARPDIVHAVYFLPPGTGRPTVLTIHDISFERFPQFFSRRALLRDRLLIRASALAATRIVTVSETSRRDLIELYGLSPSRIVAIPNGVGTGFRLSDDDAWSPYPGERPLRLLAVGTLQPRKNLLRLLEAAAILGAEIPVRIRIIGPDGHQAAQIRDHLAHKAHRGVEAEVAGWVDEATLADEYRAADVFVYPSIYEGFGLPVVEAMACGVPVVTSTGGSLPEVAGDAALIVDPYDVAGLADAILRIASDRRLAMGLRIRGIARAASFSWDRSAASHVAVYRDLVAQ